MRVAVFGLGYVGSVTAASLAALGHEVTGIDPDERKVAEMRRGRGPVREPGLNDLLEASLERRTLAVTSQLDDTLFGAQVSLLCVGTPTGPDGAHDLSQLRSVAAQIGRRLRAGSHHLVVVRSTVSPGTVEGEIVPVLEAESGMLCDEGFSVAMCPELLREGTAVADFRTPPFTVLGVRHAGSERVLRDLFSDIDAPVMVVDVPTAEATKYACNAFHAMKVSFANEMARFSDAVGADARKVMQIVAADRQLNLSPAYLRPGFAFGGSCLPKDLRGLVHTGTEQGVAMPLLGSILESNEVQLDRMVRLILEETSGVVGILGIAFKAGTDDLRESPAVTLAERLVEAGREIVVYDDLVRPGELIGANLAYAEQHLPGLAELLTDSVEVAVTKADCIAVIASGRGILRALSTEHHKPIIDATGRLGAEIEQRPNFRGLAW